MRDVTLFKYLTSVIVTKMITVIIIMIFLKFAQNFKRNTFTLHTLK